MKIRECLLQKDPQVLSVPDLTLTGHSENAEFALSISSAAPIIASGGQDTNVSFCLQPPSFANSVVDLPAMSCISCLLPGK